MIYRNLYELMPEAKSPARFARLLWFFKSKVLFRMEIGNSPGPHLSCPISPIWRWFLEQ